MTQMLEADANGAPAALSDDDANSRPAGRRRPKPVIVDDDGEEEGVAGDPGASVSVASDRVGEAALAEPQDQAQGDDQPGSGADELVGGTDTAEGSVDPVSPNGGEIDGEGVLDAPADVRTEYMDPEFATPKEISMLACNIGVQMHLARFQKKQDSPLRSGVDDAARMITFSFDPELIMESFDRATQDARASQNVLEVSRRRMKAHVDAIAVSQETTE